MGTRTATAKGATVTPLAALRPWDQNYNEGDVGAIGLSIRTFGFNGAIRVWKDGMIVAGNHAFLALRQLQDAGEAPPEHVTLLAGGDWGVLTIAVTHLSAAKARAFAIADNRSRDRARANEETLASHLVEIRTEDAPAFRATGYDDDDLQSMLANMTPAIDRPADEPIGGKQVTCPDCGAEFTP